MNPRKPFSIRMKLGLTVGVMGLLAILLAFGAGEAYRQSAVEDQRQALREIVGVGAREELRLLDETLREFAATVRGDTAIQAAVSDTPRDAVAAEQAIRQHFHRYHVTAGLITLRRIAVYDRNFTEVGASGAAPGRACAPLTTQAQGRSGTERLRMFSGLCTHDGQAAYTLFVPLSATHVTGYVEITADPRPALVHIEQRLGLPIRIETTSGASFYRSSGWPSLEGRPETMSARYEVAVPGGASPLVVTALRDASGQLVGFRNTWLAVIAAALIITLVATWLIFRQLRHLFLALEHQALTDPLTRLPNRIRFGDCLREFAHANHQANRPFALFLLDLNGFKQVNDTMGHHAGDFLLAQVGARMRGALRESDLLATLRKQAKSADCEEVLARVGGDEFAVLLPAVFTHEDAERIARKLIEGMQRPFAINHKEVTVGLSIGIVLYPEHGDEPNVLMRRADLAMYHAKQHRKGCYFFEDALEDQASKGPSAHARTVIAAARAAAAQS